MITDKKAEELEQRGLWRRAAARWQELLLNYLQEDDRICIQRRIQHCLKRAKMKSQRATSQEEFSFRLLRSSAIQTEKEMVSPNSSNLPCRALICAVRNFTSCLRERCRTSIDCCSSVLTAISLPGCCTAIQIARASITSFLLPMTNALTKRAEPPRESWRLNSLRKR